MNNKYASLNGMIFTIYIRNVAYNQIGIIGNQMPLNIILASGFSIQSGLQDAACSPCFRFALHSFDFVLKIVSNKQPTLLPIC